MRPKSNPLPPEHRPNKAQRGAAARERIGKLMTQLAVVLREVDIETDALSVPERAALVRREMEARGADDALDNFVSWFELEEEPA